MKGIRKMVSLLLVLVMVGSVVSPALATQIGKLTATSADKNLKFEKLYRTDKEFRSNVDKIRTIIVKNTLSERDWSETKKLFGEILEKLDGIRLSDKDFKILKEIIEKERPKIIAYKHYEQRKDLSILASSSIASKYLPKLYQPASDISNGNGLIKTYAKVFDEEIYGYTLPGKYIIEVTYVFADEDYPNPYLDWLYDRFREIAWGRLEDIETIFIVVDKNTGDIDRLSFVGLQLLQVAGQYSIVWVNVDPCYSGSNTWNDAAHNFKKLNSFSIYGSHPIIYINTWNHAMGEKDNNPSMSDMAFSTWMNFVNGSRMDAENAYSTITTLDETVNESP